MGKYGNGILVSDGNGNGNEWEGIGTKNLFPHTSSSDIAAGHIKMCGVNDIVDAVAMHRQIY